jgi:23S rRNA (guanosine2251-2'-O)-methyltransferase
MIIYGINAVAEALKAGRVTSLSVADRASSRALELVDIAIGQGVALKRVPAHALDRAARGGVHQGVVAVVKAREQFDIADLVDDAGEAPLIVVLDGIEDPHNVGAILRSVDAAGAHGVVRQSRHAAPLEGAAAKAAAGAVERVKIAEVVNIARALEDLKERGVWTVGLDGSADKYLHQIDLTVPTAIVLGAEGSGLRRLVKERCDWRAAIPMRGGAENLNVSVAAGIALFEAVRQRTSSGKTGNL